jgi:beta-glucanase (GH16 family)
MWGANDNECWYNEIDVVEPYGPVSAQCTTMGTNIHTNNGNIANPQPCQYAGVYNQSSGLDITGLPDLSLDYHTYGCEWLPDRVVYYFDNKVVRVVNDPNLVPLHNMSVTFDIITDYQNTNLTYNTMKVDYFRFYELKTTDCNVVINQSNFNFSNPANYSLKKSYTLTNSTLTSGQKSTLRATDFIILGNNFTVPLGAELTVNTNPCF